MLKHVIFDCDGVLVDSEPLSMRADVAILQLYGIDISVEEAHRLFVGTTFDNMLNLMTERHGIVFPPGLNKEKDRMMEELYKTQLRMVEGILGTLQGLKDRGLSMAIASNGPRQRVELALRLTGLGDFFDRVTTFEDVVNGKPAPDIYLHAAKLANAKAAQCLVVEDSATGATAGVAAGIRTLGFVGTSEEPDHHADRLKKIGVAATFSRMPDLLTLL